MSGRSGRRFRVGYAIAVKKEGNFVSEALLKHGEQRGVDYVRIDQGRPLSDQGDFDCIVQKSYSQDWNNQLVEFSAKHPDVVVVDPPHLVSRLHNRISMLESVAQLSISQKDVSFGVPKQVVVEDPTALMSRHVMEESGLEFPLIAKPLVVDGTLKSHTMCVVFDKDGLKTLETPVVLQQFVNHGMVVFKIYVAGEQVTCVKRASLPDIASIETGMKGAVSFSMVSNLAVEEYTHDKRREDVEKAEMPSLSLVKEVAKALREAMGLNLFNVDVIRDANHRGRYFIIDINYFPGYAKLPGYESFLTEFFLDILQKKTG